MKHDKKQNGGNKTINSEKSVFKKIERDTSVMNVIYNANKSRRGGETYRYD
jgi:hypothetical protein